MAHKIDKDQCLGCGACAGTCPVNAIAADDDKYKINAEQCTDCAQCADTCPVSCISKA